ncbi:MAG: DUF5009 domain-containing protein [Cyclobacteriaceae bacterium]
MEATSTNTNNNRLLSLDFYRGLTMFLLIAEFSHLFNTLVSEPFDGTFVQAIFHQFHHVKWEGLHFWDLIQPFFMFIVGVAMPLSFANRMAKGDTYQDLLKHAIKRSLLLLLLGWGLYCIGPGKIVFRFQNVLAQLSFTYMLAFLIMRKSVTFQLLVSIALLLITEGLYRFFPVDGFDKAFVAGENFGAWLNILISGKEDGGHWAIFNAVPTAAHTIWGVLAGQLLMSEKPQQEKLKLLAIAGAVGLVIGYGLSPFTPIIKRISTSTFVFAGGGWALLALALCYWLIDLKNFRWGVQAFSIVGLNPLFIYLFAHVGGNHLIQEICAPFTNALFAWTGEVASEIVLNATELFFLWYLCHWLYKRSVFIRI